ncbi:hypothetical protein ACRALDRAFT_1068967 [Sodiomyces alcalophilus JCM 7366]|uniref:uncharacterized protein n=1 Tax=Sodiomyces alcalophilus JCM 7366 TaxID=591952 RepID=UPI0039B6B8B0
MVFMVGGRPIIYRRPSSSSFTVYLSIYAYILSSKPGGIVGVAGVFFTVNRDVPARTLLRLSGNRTLPWSYTFATVAAFPTTTLATRNGGLPTSSDVTTILSKQAVSALPDPWLAEGIVRLITGPYLELGSRGDGRRASRRVIGDDRERSDEKLARYRPRPKPRPGGLTGPEPNRAIVPTLKKSLFYKDKCPAYFRRGHDL